MLALHAVHSPHPHHRTTHTDIPHRPAHIHIHIQGRIVQEGVRAAAAGGRGVHVGVWGKELVGMRVGVRVRVVVVRVALRGYNGVRLRMGEMLRVLDLLVGCPCLGLGLGLGVGGLLGLDFGLDLGVRVGLRLHFRLDLGLSLRLRLCLSLSLCLGLRLGLRLSLGLDREHILQRYRGRMHRRMRQRRRQRHNMSLNNRPILALRFNVDIHIHIRVRIGVHVHIPRGIVLIALSVHLITAR